MDECLCTVVVSGCRGHNICTTVSGPSFYTVGILSNELRRHVSLVESCIISNSSLATRSAQWAAGRGGGGMIHYRDDKGQGDVLRQATSDAIGTARTVAETAARRVATS